MQLYEQDAFCEHFTSKVVHCEKNKDSFFEVELETTAFYPEGGGQPWDLGTLNGFPVSKVIKQGEKILHFTETKWRIGEQVTGVIDWSRRFDLMQQHSGEHIVSGLAHSLYGCENVGFHMGKEFVTIDFDKELSSSQVKTLEQKANDYIWANHPVEITYPTSEALRKIDYRSKKELSGAVRIVSFPQADCCACCGTHVNFSGQVGFVVLLSCEKFREGVRITLLCGNRALGYLQKVNEQNSIISQCLSAKVLETSDSVLRQQKEKECLSQEKNALEKQYLQLLAQNYIAEGKNVIFLEEGDPSWLAKLVTEISSKLDGLICCFLVGDEGTIRYAIASKKEDVRTLSTALNEQFQGRGGGKANLVQGSLFAKKEDLSVFLTQNTALCP